MTSHPTINHRPQVHSALERSRARRLDVERQLRALRGTAQAAPLAELDSLLAYEVRLESRLAELLHHELVPAAC